MFVSFVLCTSFFVSVTSFSCPEAVQRSCRCFTTYVGVGPKVERHNVDCSSKELYQIPKLDFKKDTRLYKISLNNNSFIKISPETFSNNFRVKILDISNNPLSNTLEAGLLNNSVTGLKIVSAKGIGLDLAKDTALLFLKGLHALEELNLSSNAEYGVKHLPPLFFDLGLYSLNKLSLALCRIYAIKTAAFIGLNNVQELDLSLNYLKKVPRALHRLALLRKLNLRGNDITTVHHGDFSELRCLQELDLSGNLLGQMEAFRNGAFFGLGQSLTHLYISDADLAFIPTMAMKSLKKLTSLDLSDNKISFMSNRSFVGHYRLTSLDISGNPWLIDDDMFNGVQDSLVNLSMSRIGLPFLPTVPLSGLTRLRRLDVSYNALTIITNTSLSGITARILSFKGNKLRYVSPYAFTGYRLPIVLDVSDNDLNSIDFIFKSPKCTFFGMNITNNGFICDCHIEKLINSQRVDSLEGNCLFDGANKVSFGNVTMRTTVESQCGKTPRTFCIWWVPKSRASRAYSTNYYILIFKLVCVCAVKYVSL